MISVVIPTYNRCEKLAKTLKTLEEQTLDKNLFEAIIINDGSTDQTNVFLENYKKSSLINFRYYYQKNQGPGQARNFGASQANGSIVLFCGDDTYLDRDLLATHLKRHQKDKNIAVLGITLWDNEKINDFMKYIAPAGPQFHYNTIKNRTNAGFDHFYTSNISLEKKWFDLEKFDPSFIYAAFEDIDLGFRLEKRGLKVIYEPSAKVYHAHYYEPEDFYKRMFKVGMSAVILLKKHKSNKLDYFLLKKKYAPFCFFGLAKIFNLFSFALSESALLKKINLKYHWYWSICYYYSVGIINGLSNQKNKTKNFNYWQ